MYTVITYREFLEMVYIRGVFDRCVTDQRVRLPYAVLMCLTEPAWINR